MSKLLYNNPADRAYFNLHARKTCKQCMICGRARKLVIDHNHQNHEIRGLLCGQCNSGLGLFNDSPAILQAAKDYLTATGYHSYERKPIKQRVRREDVLVKAALTKPKHNPELAWKCLEDKNGKSQREAALLYALHHGCSESCAQTYVNRLVRGLLKVR